jgi:hypothetical protein
MKHWKFSTQIGDLPALAVFSDVSDSRFSLRALAGSLCSCLRAVFAKPLPCLRNVTLNVSRWSSSDLWISPATCQSADSAN